MHMNQIDISQKILRRKNYFPRILCFSPEISHIHKSTKIGFPGNQPKNAPTSPKHNFFENGRTRLVYDSFWPQRPPKLQKMGLWWIPQLVRPPRADLRFSRFFENFDLGRGSSETDFSTYRLSKKCSKIDFFQVSYFFQKIQYLSSILVCSHRSYSQPIGNNNPLKSYCTLFRTNRTGPILKTSHMFTATSDKKMKWFC